MNKKINLKNVLYFFVAALFLCFIISTHYYFNVSEKVKTKFTVYFTVKKVKNNNGFLIEIDTNAAKNYFKYSFLNIKVKTKTDGIHVKSFNNVPVFFKYGRASWKVNIDKLDKEKFSAELVFSGERIKKDFSVHFNFIKPKNNSTTNNKSITLKLKKQKVKTYEYLILYSITPFIVLIFFLFYLYSKKKFSGDSKRIYEIDSLKFVAILVVAVFHAFYIRQYNFVQLKTIPLIDFISKNGYLGVNLFFVISGFALFYPMALKSDEYKIKPFNYAKKRFLRIYPPYLISLIIVFTLSVVLRKSYPDLFWMKSDYLNQFITHALLIHNFWENTFFAINPALWFITVLVHLYIVFPFVAKLFKKIKPYIAFLLMFLISISYRCILYFIYGDKVWGNSVLKQLFISRLWEFAIGMLTAYYVKKINKGEIKININRVLFNAIIFISLLLCLKFVNTPIIYAFFPLNEMWSLFFALLVFYSTVKGSYLSSALKFPLFVFLGSASFSIYLIHQPIIIYVSKVLPFLDFSGTGKYILLLIVGVPVSFLVSMIFYFGVEKFLSKRLK